MKRVVAFVAAAVFAVGAPAFAGELDSDLKVAMSSAGERETISVLVYMADQADLKTLDAALKRGKATLRDRHELVVTALQARAAQTQAGVVDQLEALQAAGDVESFQSFWISNLFRVDATPAAIETLAARDDVSIMYYNYEIELVAPVRGKAASVKSAEPTSPNGTAASRAPEPGLVAVRAPEVWAQGFTGAGVLVATLDTGVDGNHEALANRWRGVADPRYAGNPDWAWFDPVTSTTFPASFGSHGTHTMGTVCGGAPGDEIGVAPGAQWIHAAVIDRVDIPTTVADAIAAFQWMLDPDGDPGTNWDVPDVCSNSWRVTASHGYPPCDETFWTYLDACEAAGIVILFSAGNEGSSPNTIGRPPDRATTDYNVCSVGAIDANTAGWPIASFSSRGPSYCTPDASPAIKPEVSAPGVEVRSSVPGGGYQSSGWSGTSMASPHVNGAVALMREACPDLLPDEIKQILYDTAVDLGSAGEDNDYGWGIIDAYEAVQIALSMCSGAPRARDVFSETPVDTAVLVTLDATDYDGEPDPPGALTFIITSMPASGATLTDAGNGHQLGNFDLPYTLVNFGNQVTFTPSGGYYGTDTFEYKANDGGVPPDAGDSNIATVSVLVKFDPPTITTDALPMGALDCAYGPVALTADQGQPDLIWAVGGEGEYTEDDLGSSLFSSVGTARGWRADDAAWSYSLPFAFPFYGAEYTQVWVCSNGFLNFGGSSTDWSNSDSELFAATRIAPLWDDLRTDYTGNDIYIDASAPGEVTFRWDAVTYASGTAVNCSCVLYDDGRIRFHYGSGNSSLSPTIGVSAGDGATYLLSMYNNSSSLPSANSLELAPPAPLPEGLVFSSTGVLSGAPLEFGDFTPRFRVTDSLNRSDEVELSLTILETGPAGDFDGDGEVGLSDLALLLSNYNESSGMTYADGDMDGDGDVDIHDLAALLAVYGASC